MVLASATAGLVAERPSGAATGALASSTAPVSDSVASVARTAVVSNGMAKLTIRLSHAETKPVAVNVIGDGWTRVARLAAGASTTTVTVPMWSSAALRVRLTSYDVTTMNGVVRQP